MTDMRVGIVGAGWGAITHVPAFRAAAGYTPVSLCGRDPARLDAAASQCGIDDTSTDWRGFIERKDLDVISVATSVASHVEIASAAVSAGKHVVVEKPVALTAAEALHLAGQARSAGVVGAACFELRWIPERFALWELVRSGRLGEIYHLRSHSNSPNWHPSHRPQAAWMYRASEGGGYLSGTLSHDVDFARALVGEIESVTAAVTTTLATTVLGDGTTVDVDADDTTMLIARSVEGASISLSTCNVAAHRNSGLIEVFGSLGSAVLRREGRTSSLEVADATDPGGFGRVAVDDHRPLDDSLIPERGAAPYARAMAIMLEELLGAFDGRATDAPSLYDGAAVEAVIEAARQSSALGERISCTGGLPPAT